MNQNPSHKGNLQPDALFSQWQTYAKLVQHNHMLHREFFDVIAGVLSQRFSKPVSILDLGCGDAVPALRLLRQIRANRYVGVDESQGALAIAGEHLDGLSLNFELACTDMRLALSRAGVRFNTVMSSYALHHLDFASKRELLRDALRRLTEDGCFIVADIFRREGESRSTYLDAWIRHAQESYTSLDMDELDLLFEHVRTRDFPEAPSVLEQLSREAGYSSFELVYQQSNGLAGVAVLTR